MTVPTNAGFAEMAKHATGTGSPVAFTFIAVGEGTGQDATDTQLADEILTGDSVGLERDTAGTISTVQTTVANDTGSWVHTFTATGTKTVSEAGIFNLATEDAGDMLIVGDLSPAAAMVSGDTLTLTMKCQFKAD